MTNKIFFVTGVSGVGKSTVIPYLKSILSEDTFVVYDFDSRGVPANADRIWRISETRYWITEGEKFAKEGKNIVICGFIRPSDIEEYNLVSKDGLEIVLTLLFAEAEIIRQRLKIRYTKNGIFDESQIVIGKPVNQFIEENVSFAQVIKSEFEKYNFPIVDTTDLTPSEVAKEVSVIMLKKINM